MSAGLSHTSNKRKPFSTVPYKFISFSLFSQVCPRVECKIPVVYLEWFVVDLLRSHSLSLRLSSLKRI